MTSESVTTSQGTVWHYAKTDNPDRPWTLYVTSERFLNRPMGQFKTQAAAQAALDERK